MVDRTDCPAAEELAAYAAAACSEEQAAAIRAHLEGCPLCAEWLAEERANDAVASDVVQAVASPAGWVDSPAGPGPLSRGEEFSSDRRVVGGHDGVPGYDIVRELGHGGQGIVYEAYQRSTRRKVAIKILFGEPFLAQSTQKRFKREIELVAKLRHPNVVTIFDSGMTPSGRRYCVMDYVAGSRLDRYVRDNALSLQETLDLFAKTCEGVDHAHEHGVMHRDLKPANVLVDRRATPYILDFGLAKQVFDPSATVVTVTQAALGTVPYMSPEQAGGSPGEVDARSDVYALGVMLYELLTGGYPYPVVGSMAEVLQHIIETPPIPLPRAWTAGSGVDRKSSGQLRPPKCPLDDDIQTIVLKALAKEPEHRYQRAMDLADDLRRYLAGEPISAKRESVVYLLRKRIRRHRASILTTLVVATLAAISAVAMFGAWGRGRGRDRPVVPFRRAEQIVPVGILLRRAHRHICAPLARKTQALRCRTDEETAQRDLSAHRGSESQRF